MGRACYDNKINLDDQDRTTYYFVTTATITAFAICVYMLFTSQSTRSALRNDDAALRERSLLGPLYTIKRLDSQRNPSKCGLARDLSWQDCVASRLKTHASQVPGSSHRSKTRILVYSSRTHEERKTARTLGRIELSARPVDEPLVPLWHRLGKCKHGICHPCCRNR